MINWHRDQIMNSAQMSIESHRLISASFVESPNQSARPAEALISLLVIHNISLPPGKFGGEAGQTIWQGHPPLNLQKILKSQFLICSLT